MKLKKLFYGVLVFLIVLSFVIIALYALDETRPWMQANITPPLLAVFGVPYRIIADSAPVQFIASNPLLSILSGMIIGICPISFPMLHRAYNAFTGFWAARKMSESSIRLPVDTGMGKPQTVSVETPQPEKVSSKKEPEPQPAPTTTEESPKEV